MDVVYSGAHPEVVVDELSQDTVIKQGVPVTVPDQLGARLIQQDTWSEVKAPSASSTPPTAPEAASVAPVAADDADTAKGSN